MNRVTKPEPVTLSTGEIAQRPIPGLYIIENKEKPKQTKKKTKNIVESVTKAMDEVSLGDNKHNSEVAADPIKKLKNLKKRLREVETLENKLKQGLIAKPEPEQLAKIQRKNDLILEIEGLEKEIQ